jgi:hypothetical protein
VWRPPVAGRARSCRLPRRHRRNALPPGRRVSDLDAAPPSPHRGSPWGSASLEVYWVPDARASAGGRAPWVRDSPRRSLATPRDDPGPRHPRGRHGSAAPHPPTPDAGPDDAPNLRLAGHRAAAPPTRSARIGIVNRSLLVLDSKRFTIHNLMWNIAAPDLEHVRAGRTGCQPGIEEIQCVGDRQPQHLDRPVIGVPDPAPDPERLRVLQDEPAEPDPLDTSYDHPVPRRRLRRRSVPGGQGAPPSSAAPGLAGSPVPPGPAASRRRRRRCQST